MIRYNKLKYNVNIDYEIKNFLNKLEEMYNLQICNLSCVNKHYPCNIYRYMLYKKNVDKVNIPYLSTFSYLIEFSKYNNFNLGYVIFIDIAICNIFPVNDFSINLLSFNGRELQVEKYINQQKEYLLSEVLNHIRKKQLILLSDFINVVDSYDEYSFDEYRMKTDRYTKFINRGYTLVI